ncbi:hypothetical protein ACGFXC_10410 [Streptomyces sp. NPDC048507]|uniref:phage tail tube protein n=1 Tax=Streptomyces sp. NPDC048507 TaxID=3365560 RepID=UPI003711BDA2
MALRAEEVRVASTGNLYVAPLGTAGPTNVSTALPATWLDLGYFSEDGVVESWDDSTADITAWQNAAIVRTVITASKGSLAVTMIQTNKNTLQAFYKGSVTAVGTPTTEYKMDVVPIKAGPSAWVLDWFDGATQTRIWVPNGEVTARGAVTYSNAGAVSYPLTISVYPSKDIAGNLMRKFSNDAAWAPTYTYSVPDADTTPSSDTPPTPAPTPTPAPSPAPTPSPNGGSAADSTTAGGK